MQLLASNDDAKAIAGGQSLVPMLAFRLSQPTLLVDLRKLADLRGIRISDAGVTLGAMQKFVGRFREKTPDWAAFEDAKIEGYKRAQHRFIGAGGSGKHTDPTVIPAKNFTLSIMVPNWVLVSDVLKPARS